MFYRTSAVSGRGAHRDPDETLGMFCQSFGWRRLNMRVCNVALFLGCAWVLGADLASSQNPKADPVNPTLTARIEVDEHQHSFSVRFFLRNNTDRDVQVVIGRGRSGMEVVPRFHLNDGSMRIISSPTYLGPARRSMKPDLRRIPAGTEILYGTFTMGYPQVVPRHEGDVELYGYIRFREQQVALRTEPQRLKIPALKQRGAGIVTTGENPQEPDSPGEWVKSDNGDLALRLSVQSPRIAATDNISVIAQIRNDRPSPVTILRPFGAAYEAKAVQIKIWSAQGRIEYSGPEHDYDLNAEAFVTIGPNEIVTDTIELSKVDFAGTDQPGTYTLRYDYTYDGSWDEVVARKGVKGVWGGRISSREIQLIKEPESSRK